MHTRANLIILPTGPERWDVSSFLSCQWFEEINLKCTLLIDTSTMEIKALWGLKIGRTASEMGIGCLLQHVSVLFLTAVYGAKTDKLKGFFQEKEKLNMYFPFCCDKV